MHRPGSGQRFQRARLRLRRAVVQGLVMLALTLGMSACSETELVLRYGTEQIAAENLPTWPQAPEVPRYIYAGELLGEGNYEVVASDRKSDFEKALAWLVGLALVPEKPKRLQRPQSVAVDSAGRILVTDIGWRSVFVFDEQAGKLYIWDQAGEALNFISPIGVIEGAGGEILVTDADLGVVVRLDREGRPLGHFGRGVLKRPTGIARDTENGRVFVADTHAHDIKVFLDTGEHIDTLGFRGERLGEFNYPLFLAYDDGNLYVSDSMNARVQILTTDGEAVRTIGERGLVVGNFSRPKGIAVDEDHNIYVVESLFDHLLVYNPQGQLLLGIGGEGNAPGQFYLPSGIGIDKRNRIFVADTFNGRVVIFQYLGST